MVVEGPVAAPVPVQNLPVLGLKRKVAVLRFSNETKYGRGVFGSKDSAIEKQAEDILKTRLVDSDSVLLIEAEAIDPENIDYGAIGADYAILGSVSEFGRQTTSETGVFSRTKKQVAYAAVNLRMVDTRTGQVVYAEEGRGEADIESGRVMGVGTDAGYDSSINDRAISAAIAKLIGNILQNMADDPWRTAVLQVEDGQVLIAGGPLQGLEKGMTLAVIRRGRIVDNPQAGGKIELPGTRVGTLEILDFFGQGPLGEGAVCALVSGDLSGASLDSLAVVEDSE